MPSSSQPSPLPPLLFCCQPLLLHCLSSTLPLIHPTYTQCTRGDFPLSLPPLLHRLIFHLFFSSPSLGASFPSSLTSDTNVTRCAGSLLISLSGRKRNLNTAYGNKFSPLEVVSSLFVLSELNRVMREKAIRGEYQVMEVILHHPSWFVIGLFTHELTGRPVQEKHFLDKKH